MALTIYDKLLLNALFILIYQFIARYIARDNSKIAGKKYLKHFIFSISGCILSLLLLFYTFEVAGTSTLIDLRYFALASVYSWGGIVPMLATGVFQMLYRVEKYGMTVESLPIVLQIGMQLGLIVLLIYLIDKLIKNELKKWAIMQFSILILVLGLYISTYEQTDIHVQYLIAYSFATIVIAVLQFYLMNSLKQSNQLYERYKMNSKYDFLTGLINRREFDHCVREYNEKAVSENHNLFYLMLDIDHFKKVNDTFGHNNGDVVLKEYSRILMEVFTVSIPIGRVGGEEFCVLLNRCELETALEKANCFKDRIEKHPFVLENGEIIGITTSIGIAGYPQSSTDIEQIKELADSALYDAKHTGRNKVCIR